MSIAFERAKKTFLGFLEARGRSKNTIRNYAADLNDLMRHCDQFHLEFRSLSLQNLGGFHRRLQKRGLSRNSQRRKLLTARFFLRYLSGRMDVSTVGSERFVAPERFEQAPRIPARRSVEAILAAQDESGIGLRNRALIGVLLETGMLVSEALSLQKKALSKVTRDGGLIEIRGQRARMVRCSAATVRALRKLSRHLTGRKFFFYGYNPGGPNAECLSSRGVEVLFLQLSKQYKVKHFRARAMRHLFVLNAIESGWTQKQIQQSLGLRTAYAFGVYDKLAKREGVKSTN